MSVTAGTIPSTSSPRRGFRRFWLALKELFHEVMGALFAVLALFWTQNALRAWSKDGAHWLIGVAAFLAVLMAVFSFGSFRNARRMRSS